MTSYKIPFVLIILLVPLSCEVKGQDEQEKSSVHLINSEDFSMMISGEPTAQLIDIRTPEEYSEGHLKDSKLINFYDSDFKEQISKLDKNKPVFFYCKSGGRSAKASKIFQEQGFAKVIELKGGITNWQQNGKEVVK